MHLKLRGILTSRPPPSGLKGAVVATPRSLSPRLAAWHNDYLPSNQAVAALRIEAFQNRTLYSYKAPGDEIAC